MRFLVDTNVLMDVLYKREGLYEDSKLFFERAREYRDHIYVCSSTIKDLAYFIKKTVRDNEKTNKILINIFGKITKIVGISADDAINALYEDGDYEDNVLVEVTQTSMCDALITNNVKDFIDKYLEAFPGINEYMNKEKEEAYKNGYVKTLMNRRRE